ncbi:hypothetical protein [Flavisericum labens]|uniref:hypothetical protein n=1 Tax=Flavisericum labens TaxID=3377112 RepID=UPI00387A8880
MVVLKKIKASTLMETLVATVLVVVIFMISSVVLNNLFSSNIRNNTRALDAYLNEIHYLYRNEKLTIPFYDDLDDWEISVEYKESTVSNQISFESINRKTDKQITKTTHENR